VSLRPAATVVLIADQHVLLIQRAREIQFFGGAYAFPGGRVEAADAAQAKLAPHAEWSAMAPLVWCGHPPAGDDFCADQAQLFGAYEVAARREVEEESGLKVDVALLPWARWITPEPEPKRYDTLFFLARVQRGDVVVDGSETIAHRWLTPQEALALHQRGEIVLPPPTYVTLTELATHGGWAQYEQMVRDHGVPEVFPKIELVGEEMWLALPPIKRGWPAGMATRGQITLTAAGVRATFGT